MSPQPDSQVNAYLYSGSSPPASFRASSAICSFRALASSGETGSTRAFCRAAVPQVTLLRSRRLVGLSGSAVSLSLARERHVFGLQRVAADLSQPLGFRTAPA